MYYVKTENIKTEEIFNTEHDYWGKEDVQKTIKSNSLPKQENQVKKYHHERTEKNVIGALKKLDTSYNPVSLN